MFTLVSERFHSVTGLVLESDVSSLCPLTDYTGTLVGGPESPYISPYFSSPGFVYVCLCTKDMNLLFSVSGFLLGWESLVVWSGCGSNTDIFFFLKNK